MAARKFRFFRFRIPSAILDESPEYTFDPLGLLQSGLTR
jgi:hypothetical protein